MARDVLIKVSVPTARIAMVPVSRIVSLVMGKSQNPRKLSEKPMRYRLTLNERPKNSAIPSVPPIGRPKVREMI